MLKLVYVRISIYLYNPSNRSIMYQAVREFVLLFFQDERLTERDIALLLKVIQYTLAFDSQNEIKSDSSKQYCPFDFFLIQLN